MLRRAASVFARRYFLGNVPQDSAGCEMVYFSRNMAILSQKCCRRFAPESSRNFCSVTAHQPSTSKNYQTESEPCEVFEKILYKLKESGHVVVLPSKNDQSAGYKEPIRVLQNFGFDDDKIVDIFVTKPELFKIPAPTWEEKLAIFQETGFTVFQTIFILTRNPKIFNIPRMDLLNKLETVRRVGVKGDRLPNMVYSSPEIITDASNDQIRISANNLKSFFTTEQVIELFSSHPRVIFQNFDDIEEKYEYIYFEMGLESSKFRQSVKWVAAPIEFIQMRHEILTRTGAYIRPNPKKPMLSKDNPKLPDIFDTNEYIFATKVAGITLEEYQVFREMFNRQLEMESREEDYEIDLEEADGFEPNKNDSEDEKETRHTAREDDDQDFGGWKKNKKHYYMHKKTPKPAMRKRKGRY